MKKIFWIVVILVILSAALWHERAPKTEVTGADYKNVSYIIDGLTAKYFGNDATGDLNGDGVPDAAFLVTTDGGGSGTFYYAVAALNISGAYVGTNAILLGDRIAPQTTEIKDGEVIVNYADRKPSDPMTAQPSVGVTKRLHISGTSLVEDTSLASEGEHCGGNMATAKMCATGLQCVPNSGSHLPFGDVGGICAKSGIDSTTSSRGLLSGFVTLSPTCPVEKIPPDPQCAPRGYVTTIDAISSDQKIVSTTQSKSDGSFTMNLAYGAYTLKTHDTNPYPRCAQQEVTIDSSSSSVNITCDTGIR